MITKATLILGLSLGIWVRPLFAASVTVPGTADPWLAGMPDGSRASSGDMAPRESPILVQGITLEAGRALMFSASGGVTRQSGNSLRSPDGAEIISHVAGAKNGIGNLTAPYESLIGIFLGTNAPSLSPTPTSSSFTTPASSDYAILQPQLKQPFFIGDRRTATGAGQLVIVPTGATRLFLGVMDSSDWSNNAGAFSVEITATGKRSTRCHFNGAC